MSRRSDLFKQFVPRARDAGYSFTRNLPENIKKKVGQCVFELSKDSHKEICLIQCRSYSSKDRPRYTIGLMHADMQHVESVFLWFEDGEYLFKVPAKVLCTLFNAVKKEGTSAIRGRSKDQWLVNVFLDSARLIPQDATKCRNYFHQLDLSGYLIGVDRG